MSFLNASPTPRILSSRRSRLAAIRICIGACTPQRTPCMTSDISCWSSWIPNISLRYLRFQCVRPGRS